MLKTYENDHRVRVNWTNGYWHCHRNAMRQWNIFYKMPTTIGTRICRCHRMHHDCNSAFGKRSRAPRAMAFACVDCMVIRINHSRILTQHSHRWHSVRIVRAPPCDSICPKCYRIKCPSVCYTTTMPEWNAFSDAQPMILPPSIGPVSTMALSISWMSLSIGEINYSFALLLLPQFRIECGATAAVAAAESLICSPFPLFLSLQSSISQLSDGHVFESIQWPDNCRENERENQKTN